MALSEEQEIYLKKALAANKKQADYWRGKYRTAVDNKPAIWEEGYKAACKDLNRPGDPTENPYEV